MKSGDIYIARQNYHGFWRKVVITERDVYTVVYSPYGSELSCTVAILEFNRLYMKYTTLNRLLYL
jgi:hypothetical protein